MGGFWRRLAALNAGFLAPALRILADQLEHLFPGPPVVAVMFFKEEGNTHMGEITVKDTSDPLTATVTFLDAEGHETTPTEPAEWSSSDETVASVTASEDGTSASIAVGGPGAAVIHVGSGEAVAEGTVTVQAGDAVIGEVNFTAP